MTVEQLEKGQNLNERISNIEKIVINIESAEDINVYYLDDEIKDVIIKSILKLKKKTEKEFLKV